MNKTVVFDVDETLGFFVELGVFWEALKSYTQWLSTEVTVLTQIEFNECLDLYPEFIRPNIIPILTYLKHKKMSGVCSDVMIYTNNQGPHEWIHYIVKYFEEKINYPIFNHIITAFKKNGKQVELSSRTSHNKSHSDLIKCTKISPDTRICFIDDTYYSEMNNDNIYYIKIKPYIHTLHFDDMIERFITSNTSKKIITNNDSFRSFMTKTMNRHSFIMNIKSKEEYEIEKITSKKIIIHIQTFFST